MSTVFSGNLARALKRTLDRIITDKSDGVESAAIFPKYCKVKTMQDQWEDDQEYAGPGLASEKSEGAELSTGTILEGYTTRYIARTFGLKLIITEEALEDNKYDMVIQAAKRLKRSMWKTADYDAVNMLVRAENSAYVGGDGQPLASTAHTLAAGGTWSNKMSTPMSPSAQAVTIARAAMMRFPGHDSLIEGVEPEKVVITPEGWGDWEGLTKSSMRPEAGNFAEINVVKGLDLEVCINKYWTNTTSNYAYITDNEDGLQFRWKRKARGRSWVDNDHETMKYSNSARWSRGWSNARGVYWVGI